MENESESLRKELAEARRELSCCSAERDKLSAAARDLREHVKRADHERRDAARARDDAYHKIAGISLFFSLYLFVACTPNGSVVGPLGQSALRSIEH